mmetsp:Transcript_8400/g.9587  ORF Transcript_8400/g.9587 Transcript_8400/m.9587 type:complete len:432 (-) Transcript_8400:403-1698(-)
MRRRCCSVAFPFLGGVKAVSGFQRKSMLMPQCKRIDFSVRSFSSNSRQSFIKSSEYFKNRGLLVGVSLSGVAALSLSLIKQPSLNENELFTASVASCDKYEFSDARSRAQLAYEKPFGPNTIADAVEVASPSLVHIKIRIAGPWGQEGHASGSGFVIDSSGLIATNAHVVQRSENVIISLSDGREFNAKVHSMDKHTDIALVKITDILSAPLVPIEFGDSSELRAGEWVVALGSPLNMANSVTAGIVSSTIRQASELGIPQRRTDYIQTDAAINQGNSGGPLINLKGEVVGINTMKIAGTGGIGFAIPMETASVVIQQLKDTGKVVRPYVGLRMMPLNKHIIARERRIATKFPAGISSGVLVTSVTAKSPGEEAGLRAGDIIASIDGKPVRTIHDITQTMGYDIGRTHEFQVVRKDGSRVSIRVTTRGAIL